MKCVTIFLAITFVVSVNSAEDSTIQNELNSLRNSAIRRVIQEGGRRGGNGGVRVHRITGQYVTRKYRFTGNGGVGGGEEEINVGNGGGGGGDGLNVHRFTGQLQTRIHRFGNGGGNGEAEVPDVPNNDGGKVSDGPKSDGGLKGRGGKKGRENANIKCRKSGLTALADEINSNLQGLVNNIANGAGANAQKPGILGNLFGGVQTALDNAIGGLDQGVSDFFCGFNRVFNKIGSQINKGNIVNAVLSGGNVFVTGAGSFFANLGTNAIGAVTSGVSDLIHGRRSKNPNRIVHSHHGDLTDVV